MSKKSVTRALLLGGLIMSYGSLTQAAPILGAMNITANAAYREEISADPQRALWSTVPRELSLTSVSTVPGISTVGFGNATWAADGNAGTARFGMGWEQSHGGWASFYDDGRPNYRYAFVADFDGQFVMNYDISVVGPAFGLSGWAINWSGAGGDLSLYNPVDPTARGTFTREIVAGETYYLAMSTSANLTGGGSRSALMSSVFDFEMTPSASAVAEPGNVALIGMGLAALLMRRKRRESSLHRRATR